MTRRLRDESNSADERLARAAELVRSARTLTPSDAAYARVARRLERSGARARRAPRSLVPVLVAVAVLVVAGAAAAMIGRWVAAHERRPPDHPVSQPVGVPGRSPAPRERIVLTPIAPPVPPRDATDPAPPDPPMRSAPPAPMHREPAHPAGGAAQVESLPASPQPVPAPSAPPPVTPESYWEELDPATTVRREAGTQERLIRDALKALREDRDPDGALLLLSYYLDTNPDGALAEEALALEVEAAATRGGERLAALAAEYLRRYPSGHYRDRVRASTSR